MRDIMPCVRACFVPALEDDDRSARRCVLHLQRLQAVQFNALTGCLPVSFEGLDRSRDAIPGVLDAAGYVLTWVSSIQLRRRQITSIIQRSGPRSQRLRLDTVYGNLPAAMPFEAHFRWLRPPEECSVLRKL
jgi:hypothetical protein